MLSDEEVQLFGKCCAGLDISKPLAPPDFQALFLNPKEAFAALFARRIGRGVSSRVGPCPALVESPEPITDEFFLSFWIGFFQGQNEKEQPTKKAILSQKWDSVDFSRPTSLIASELGVSTQAVQYQKKKRAL